MPAVADVTAQPHRPLDAGLTAARSSTSWMDLQFVPYDRARTESPLRTAALVRCFLAFWAILQASCRGGFGSFWGGFCAGWTPNWTPSFAATIEPECYVVRALRNSAPNTATATA